MFQVRISDQLEFTPGSKVLFGGLIFHSPSWCKAFYPAKTFLAVLQLTLTDLLTFLPIAYFGWEWIHSAWPIQNTPSWFPAGHAIAFLSNFTWGWVARTVWPKYLKHNQEISEHRALFPYRNRLRFRSYFVGRWEHFHLKARLSYTLLKIILWLPRFLWCFASDYSIPIDI